MRCFCKTNVRYYLKKITNFHLKPLVLQKQHIKHFSLKLLSTPCEVVQDGIKWDDSDWALNLTDGFMIQFKVCGKSCTVHYQGIW